MNIAKKNFIDAKKFFSNDDIHKRNGLPWPRIDPSNITEKIKLVKKFLPLYLSSHNDLTS